MKNIYILFLLLISSSLQALPVGNPIEASLHRQGILCVKKSEKCDDEKEDCENECSPWSYRLGFYGDFVFDRHMQIDTKESNAHLHSTQIFTEAAYWAINLWNKADLFGTFGATRIRFEAPRRTFGNFSSVNDYTILETDTDFSWSLGARWTIWECHCFGIGAEAQYICARPHINFAHNLGFEDLIYPQSNVILKYREWQAGLGIAYRISFICEKNALIPYFAIRVGRATMQMDNFQIVSGLGFDRFSNLETDEDWGYVLGMTLLGCDKISVTGEVRLLTEKALYINSQFRF